MTRPSPDPGETFPHVNVQIFGTEHPEKGATPKMSGFVADFIDAMKTTEGWDEAERPTRMPREYAPIPEPDLNRHFASELQRGIIGALEAKLRMHIPIDKPIVEILRIIEEILKDIERPKIVRIVKSIWRRLRHFFDRL